ncbi:PEP-CTERM sorting domain-containing protein [Alteromonas facilis]|uniref:PEP-CTERM sorting domain-containing protein n=1 Tax=Alteromonas facilis TaxID=2048004 RepID=UPI000C2942DF|nr:PEP-CTERM sorting domain-containing protein [Alteromonas facilis]
MIKRLLAGVFALTASVAAYAVPITDVQDYTSNTASEYFVDNDANKYDSGIWRGASEDWGWVHNAIAGTFSSIILEISAFDIDSPDEIDNVYAWDGSDWFLLGNLMGTDDTWEFTVFDLTGYAWAETQVNAGLQLWLDIDVANEGWLVTLAKSTLSVDGGNQQCVPQPGAPCTSTNVSEPYTVALLGLSLFGLASVRRRKQA